MRVGNKTSRAASKPPRFTLAVLAQTTPRARPPRLPAPLLAAPHTRAAPPSWRPPGCDSDPDPPLPRGGHSPGSGPASTSTPAAGPAPAAVKAPWDTWSSQPLRRGRRAHPTGESTEAWRSPRAASWEQESDQALESQALCHSRLMFRPPRSTGLPPSVPPTHLGTHSLSTHCLSGATQPSSAGMRAGQVPVSPPQARLGLQRTIPTSPLLHRGLN